VTTKQQRQHRISKLLEEHRVSNQSQLVELLASAGVTVNQATVSRDLEELGAIKVRMSGGEPVYAVPELPREQVAPEEHLRRVVGDWVVDIDRSGDLVVLRTPPGSAHVVGSAIDRNGMDDTVLVVARAGRGADLCATMADLAGLG
jgi:transcriptional regulator of arginine metabolism